MPTRMLHEKVCVSVTLAELTAEEERFFYRLLVKADDHGRYHAHPAILLGNLFPLQAGMITANQVQGWRDRLEEVGLIQTYRVEGREYLVIATWSTHQRQRASTSKFPDPPSCGQLPTFADIGGQMLLARRQDRGPVDDRRETIDGDDRRGPGAAAHARDAAAPPSALPAEKAKSEGFEVPDSVAGFHAAMRGTRGYRPSAPFLAQVAERYGTLDLTQEGLTMADWLSDPDRNRRGKQPTAKFMLDWLARSLEDRSTTAVPESRGTVVRSEPVAVVPPADADEALWIEARDLVKPDVSRINFESWVLRLALAGRDQSGALVLRAPPGGLRVCQPYQSLVRRALMDLGDPHGSRAVIVE